MSDEAFKIGIKKKMSLIKLNGRVNRKEEAHRSLSVIRPTTKMNLYERPFHPEPARDEIYDV